MLHLLPTVYRPLTTLLRTVYRVLRTPVTEPTMSTTEPLQVHLRWMIRRDLPEVLAIEQESFEFPWGLEDFFHCLGTDDSIALVAELSGRGAASPVVGFMVFQFDHCGIQLLNLAVAAAYRRRGLGRQMLVRLTQKLAMLRRERIEAVVRETNLGAQMFLRDSGYRATKILRGFFEDTPEDAYLMTYRLGELRGEMGEGREKREAGIGTRD